MLYILLRLIPKGGEQTKALRPRFGLDGWGSASTINCCTHRYLLPLLIPKSKLTPRSIPMPRSQPMSSYPLYSSLMPHHTQMPISIATKHLAQPWYSINPPVSAETLIITHRLCIISVDSNQLATFDPSALRTLATRSQLYQKGCSPSPVSIYFLLLLLTRPCFNIPDLQHSHYLTLGHMIFPVWTIIHPWLP